MKKKDGNSFSFHFIYLEPFCVSLLLVSYGDWDIKSLEFRLFSSSKMSKLEFVKSVKNET